MFAISSTDGNWFNYLKDNELSSYVNFWTPTPRNTKDLKEGDRFYFMLKSPVWKIGGFGEFVRYENITPELAWNKFGNRNGNISKQDFINSIQEYMNKNSEKYGKRTLDTYSYKLGSIVLRNCEFWDKQDYKDPEDYDIKFPLRAETIRCLDQDDPFLHDNSGLTDFGLVNEPREDNVYVVKYRNGQSVFKGKILKAYNNTCCITGETMPELLEAVHIQKYANKYSNHVQNGVLLRVDIHRLFDSNLLIVDKDYTIRISSLVTDEYYKHFDGKKINLPLLEQDRPSVEALALRENEFRR
ncbi:hypothetical protein D3C87_524560 [compost metagenome]